MAFFKCNGLWCRRWAALQNPAEATETSFHLPASYAEDVGRKRASLVQRFFLLLMLRGVWWMACTPTLTHPLLLSLIYVLSAAWEITTSFQLVSYDWFSMPARIALLTLFVTLVWSSWAFTKYKKEHPLMRFLLVYKVGFHLCNTVLSFHSYRLPSGGRFVPNMCLHCVVLLYGMVWWQICSGFLSDYTLVWIG